jgi:hypothetical protein
MRAVLHINYQIMHFPSLLYFEPYLHLNVSEKF